VRGCVRGRGSLRASEGRKKKREASGEEREREWPLTGEVKTRVWVKTCNLALQ
jgi:hypothetical protein